MSHLAHVGDALAMHARMYPDKVGARDLEREMTFRVWHRRASPACQCACSGSDFPRAIASASSPTIASSGWKSTRRLPWPG